MTSPTMPPTPNTPPGRARAPRPWAGTPCRPNSTRICTGWGRLAQLTGTEIGGEGLGRRLGLLEDVGDPPALAVEQALDAFSPALGGWAGGRAAQRDGGPDLRHVGVALGAGDQRGFEEVVGGEVGIVLLDVVFGGLGSNGPIAAAAGTRELDARA